MSTLPTGQKLNRSLYEEATRLVLTLVCFAGFILPAYGAKGWQHLGPPGGEIQQLAVDRNHPNVVLAVVSNLLYRSDDYGHHWERVPIDLSKGRIYPVLPITIHPFTSEIFLRTSSGSRDRLLVVWASNDLGRSFEIRFVGSTESFLTPRRFRGSPFDSTWYGETDWGIVFSFDQGRSWRLTGSFPKFPPLGKACGNTFFSIIDFAVSPFNPKVLYAAGIIECSQPPFDSEDTFLISNDAGRSWNVQKNIQIKQFSLDPAFPNRLFGMSNDALYSLNHGFYLLDRISGWRKISNESIFTIAPDTVRPSHLYALKYSIHLKHKMIESYDLGQTWTAGKLFPPEPILDIVALRNKSRNLLSVSRRGIYRHVGGTSPKTWKFSSSGMKGGDIEAIGISKTTLYTSQGHSFDDHFVRSKDNGRTWIDLAAQFPPGFLEQISANPQNPEEVIVSLDNGSGDLLPYLSQNGGHTWERIPIIDHSTFYDPINPSTVYFVYSDTLYRSKESGRNPQEVPTPGIRFESMWIDETNSNTLYLFGSYSKIYKSTDSGSSFRVITQGIQPANSSIFSIAPVHAPNDYLIVTSSGIYETQNAGETWERVAPRQRNLVGEIVSADQSGHHFFIMRRPDQVFESVDTGRTWVDISSEIDPLSRLDFFTITANRAGAIYVGTNAGIYRSPR